MRRWIAALTLLILAGQGCGGSEGPSGPDGPGGPINGTFTARIDGSNWSATDLTPVMAQLGQGSVIGASSTGRAIAFAWVDQGPGTYTIAGSTGMNASLTEGSGMWMSSISGGSGSLTIQTRTANRVTGTFTFTMVPGPGTSATGTRTITNGAFDVTF